MRADHLLAQARERFAVQDYYGAAHLLEEVVASERSFADAHHLLGLCLALLGHRERAIAAFERALELNPRYIEANIHRGILLSELGRSQEAEAAFRAAAAWGKPPPRRARSARRSSSWPVPSSWARRSTTCATGWPGSSLRRVARWRRVSTWSGSWPSTPISSMPRPRSVSRTTWQETPRPRATSGTGVGRDGPTMPGSKRTWPWRSACPSETRRLAARPAPRRLHLRRRRPRAPGGPGLPRRPLRGRGGRVWRGGEEPRRSTTLGQARQCRAPGRGRGDRRDRLYESGPGGSRPRGRGGGEIGRAHV